MNRKNARVKAVCASTVGLIILAASHAAMTNVVVNARCNIYGSAHSSPPAGVVGSPGIIPVQVPLELSGSESVEFDLVRGDVDFNFGGQ